MNTMMQVNHDLKTLYTIARTVVTKEALNELIYTEFEEGKDFLDQLRSIEQGEKMNTVKFKRLREDAQIPKKSTEDAACFDVYLPETYKPLDYAEVRIVPLGFSVAVPSGFELQVRARSGLASKGLMVANGVGCVDADYRGEVGVILFNASDNPMPLNKGDRICQLKLSYVPPCEFMEVKDLDETVRGEGGFGSTGL